MNKILVEVSVGELLDKISILEIKKEKIKDSQKLNFINEEYNVLKEQLTNNIKSDETLEKLFQSLKEIAVFFAEIPATVKTMIKRGTFNLDKPITLTKHKDRKRFEQFIPNKRKITFAQMLPNNKFKIDHRSKACKKIKRFF